MVAGGTNRHFLSGSKRERLLEYYGTIRKIKAEAAKTKSVS